MSQINLVVKLANAAGQVMVFERGEHMKPDTEYTVPKVSYYLRRINEGDLIKVREEKADEVPAHQQSLLAEVKRVQSELARAEADAKRASVDAQRAREDAEDAQREAVELRARCQAQAEELDHARRTVESLEDEIERLRSEKGEEGEEESEEEDEETGPDLT